jgi:hypothetical protein
MAEIDPWLRELLAKRREPMSEQRRALFGAARIAHNRKKENSVMDATFKNNATMKEKAEVLRNEHRLREGDRSPATYHSVAMVQQELESNAGRYGRTNIAGESESVEYPRQPFSPWTNDVNVSPPLGVAIDAMEPVGAPHEIEASIQALAASAHCDAPFRSSTGSVASSPSLPSAAANPQPMKRRKL